MPIRIKICGITRLEDARLAVKFGADALGFIFAPKSPRFIHPLDSCEIIRQLPPLVTKVGVFVDDSVEVITDIIHKTGIDTIQLHGSETPQFAAQFTCSVIKAFSIKPGFDLSLLEPYKVSGYLLDTWDASSAGGTGKTFDWNIARLAAQKYSSVILAGGLGSTNIVEAIEIVSPYAVDVNSGVEVKPGIKNPLKMRDVINAVKNFK